MQHFTKRIFLTGDMLGGTRPGDNFRGDMLAGTRAGDSFPRERAGMVASDR